MSLAAGAISKVSSTSTTANLVVAAATGGTGPYTYQWYRSTTTGFTPGGGNIIAGATALSLADTGLIPNTAYFYKNIVTDTGNSNVTATSSQLEVDTSSVDQSQNVFSQSPILGMIDQRFNYNTTPCEVDVSQSGVLYPGQAVKMVDSADGVPKVVGCTADADEVFGFINYDIKSRSYAAGAACEVSQAGNVMYLYAANAIARGAQVQLNFIAPGSVAAKVGSSGADIVGYAFDKASAGGALIRVKLGVPSFLKA